jgi:hypothetical protein
MQTKRIIYGLSGVWFVLFVVSFVVMAVVEPTGDGFTRGLNRVVSFLTWQGLAFVAAMTLAALTYRAVGRGVDKVRLVGYAPLAVSVFLVGSFVVIMAYRMYVAPLLPATG